MKELIIAFGLFLFIEGILYAIFPSKMKSMLKKLNEVSTNQLRTGGFVFAIIFGYFIWNEVPSNKTLMGSLMVILSSLIIFRREIVLKKNLSASRHE